MSLALTDASVSSETDGQFERELRAAFVPGVTSDLSEEEYVEAILEAKPRFDEELRRDRRLRTYVVHAQRFGHAERRAYPQRAQRGRGEARPSGRRARAVASSSGDPP